MSSEHFHRPDIDNFVLVYTMGKVGSVAIMRSLEAVGVFCRHLQHLSPDTQGFIDKLHQIRSNRMFSALSGLNRARAHSALLDREYAGIIKVITAVRTPVDQILSQWFQGFEIYNAHASNIGRPADAASFIEIILDGVNDFLAQPNRTMSELTDQLTADNLPRILFSSLVLRYVHWFDHEFVPFFPTRITGGQMADGYQIAGNVMILKFEELATHGEKAIAEYTQRPHFKLLRDNVGADKEHGPLYSEILRTIKFPAAFVEYLCESKYVRHFYGEDELRAHKQRWIGEGPAKPVQGGWRLFQRTRRS